MCKYLIELDQDRDYELELRAKSSNISKTECLQELVNLFLIPVHKLEYTSMRTGYESMGEINLELANDIGDNPHNANTAKHNQKGRNILRRFEPGSRERTGRDKTDTDNSE